MIDKFISTCVKTGQGIQNSLIKVMAMMEIKREGTRKYKVTLLVFFFCLFYLSLLVFWGLLSSNQFENIFVTIVKIVLLGFFGGNAVENLTSIIIGKHKNSNGNNDLETEVQKEDTKRQNLMEKMNDVGK